MKNKSDLRIIKTKKALLNALTVVMGKKSFEEIKVNDICQEALVNRSTFYAHYNDKYELLSDYIEDIKNDLINTLEKNSNSNFTKKYFLEMINLILNHIDENRKAYVNIFKYNRNGIFMDFVLDTSYKFLSERIKKSTNANFIGLSPDFVSKFYFGAIMYTAFDWIRNNSNYSKEEIIEYLDKLIPNID